MSLVSSVVVAPEPREFFVLRSCFVAYSYQRAAP